MLATVIGDVLPLTLAIAVSPLTIVAVILMLLAPNARRTGPGFLLGWGIGVIAPVTVFVLVAGALPQNAEESGPDFVRASVQFVLALLLLILGVKRWRGRPAPGTDPVLPKWMSAIDSFNFGRALSLGLLLSIPRPKNLLVAASAGMIIGGAELTVASTTIATTAFALCAVSTVLVPVIAYLLASERLRKPLEEVHEWLARENSVITSVLLLVIAVVMIGKGLGSL